MRYLVTIVLMFCLLQTTAQNNKIEAIRKELQKQTAADTFRVKSLIKLAESTMSLNMDTALKAITEGIQIVQKFNYPPLTGICYKTKADIFFTYSIYDSSEIYYLKSIPFFDKGKDVRRSNLSLFYCGVAQNYNNKSEESKQSVSKAAANFEAIQEWSLSAKALRTLGAIEQNESEYTKAYEFFNKGLIHAKLAKDTPSQQILLNDFGALYFLVGDYDRSFEYRLASLKIAELRNDSTMISILYNALGTTYKLQDNITKAEEFYRKALLFTRLGKDDYTNYSHVNTLSSLANIYNLKKEYAKSDSLHNQAINEYRRQKEWSDVLRCMVNKGGNLLDAGKKQEAYTVINELIGLAKEKWQPRNLAYGELKKAEIIASLDKPTATRFTGYSKPYDSAIVLCNRSLSFFKLSKEIAGQSQCYEQLISLHKLQNNNTELAVVLESFLTLKDSLHQQDKRAEIVRKEMEYLAEKDLAAAAAQIQQEKTARKNIFIISLAVIIAFAVVLWLYKRRRDALQKQVQLENKAAMASIEMRVLRLQMNPHFIFNALNSISHYIQMNDSIKADYYLTRFAKLIRATLENSEYAEISLVKEIEMLKMYMDIESLRLNQNFRYEIAIDESIDPNNTMIPPLILQPFVENSIWHGIASYTAGGFIRIEITRSNEYINCIVEDNGVGIRNTKGENTSHRSLGMHITKERISLLNKMKKTNAAINIVDIEKGTRVELLLPYETDEI